MNQNIGFIGLGSLGTPIAMNLLESGHVLHVYNRTASKAKSFGDKGAIVSGSIVELARECSIVFTIVSDDAALKSICEGEKGLLKNLQKGSLHISMSTILPKTAEELSLLHEKNGLHYLASPVFGRPEAARVKKLNFVVSGNEENRKLAEPLLKEAGGMNVFDFGDSITAANTVKLCGNFLIASALEAIGESINLAQKSGICCPKLYSIRHYTRITAILFCNKNLNPQPSL